MLHALGGANCKISEGAAAAGALEALKLFLSCASCSTCFCALLGVREYQAKPIM